MTLTGSVRYKAAMIVAIQITESLTRQGAGRHVPEMTAMFGIALGIRVALADPDVARALAREVEATSPQTGGGESMEILFRRLADIILDPTDDIEEGA